MCWILFCKTFCKLKIFLERILSVRIYSKPKRRMVNFFQCQKPFSNIFTSAAQITHLCGQIIIIYISFNFIQTSHPSCLLLSNKSKLIARVIEYVSWRLEQIITTICVISTRDFQTLHVQPVRD